MSNDRRSWSVYRSNLLVMLADLIHYLFRIADSFERWFEQRFGWFFTNGMKSRRDRRPDVFKA